MLNQQFCYWLQGYFEVSRELTLTKEKILLIDGSLKKINEPLGSYTTWLTHVIAFFAAQEYRPELLTYFLPEIRERLNYIFYHYIDLSYDTEVSIEDRRKVHEGIAP
ncbi:MAG: hypothetical protein ABI597_00830 [Gammaproteobacteria bacterium]